MEAIRSEQLARLGTDSPGNTRDPILAKRDAIVTSLMYGLGARPQEIWGMRWSSIAETFATVEEAISWGELDEYGKTSNSTERRPRMPRLLYEDLLEWRLDPREWGHPAADLDFLIPGDLGGKRWGVIDPDTGACHLSLSQCRKWGTKFFGPAVKKAAAQPQLAAIAGATPYSLRRGGISLRLRAEDPQTVAADCGTSNRMLDEHYRFAIDDLRRFGPRPFNEEWSAARAAHQAQQAGGHLHLAAA